MGIRSCWVSLAVVALLLILIRGYTEAQPYGPEGNRATGVVYRGDADKPFKSGEAVVELYKREKSNDKTNDDGLYYVLIPKDLQQYQLVYRASGYWSQISEPPTKNSQDPDKRKRVSLRKKDSQRDPRNLEELARLLQSEYSIYQGSTSNVTREALKSDLMSFLSQLRTSGVEQRAIIMVEEVLRKM